MPTYVDGFVIPIQKRNLAAYRKLATLAGKIWKEYGALDYKECLADDLDVPFGRPFTKLVKLERGETLLFSFITYKSRAHRDRVNAKVMKDPRLQSMDPKDSPFDVRRMSYGGFTAIVER